MAEYYTSRINLKDVTFANSGQYVSIEYWPDDNILGKATSMTLDLYVWTGEKASVPLEPTISLIQTASQISTLAPDGTFCVFKIDEFISSELDESPVTVNYPLNNCKWYKVIVTASTASTTWDSGTKLATVGWGSYDEGANPGVVNPADLSGQIFNLANQNNISPNAETMLNLYIGEHSTNKKISKTSFANGEGTTDLVGIQFDGISTYMDLGIVPLLNSQDSYVKLNFKATNWDNSNPFGYAGAGSDRFQVNKLTDSEIYGLQNGTNITVSPSDYPNPDSYQEFGVTVLDYPDPWTLQVDIGSYTVGDMQDVDFTPRDYSGIPFYLGARNTGGAASNFTNVIFTQAEFFNGTDLKIFNHANNWGGATNYGGKTVFSGDGGTTWSDTPSDMITLPSGSTLSSSQFFVANYTTLQPVKCINDGYTLVDTNGDVTNYPYKLIDIKDQGVNVTFFGKNGSQMNIILFGRLKTTTNYNRDTYENTTINRNTIYNPSEHSIKTQRTQSHNSFTLYTGIMTPGQIEILEQMLVSEKVWVFDEDVSGSFRPVVIINNAINWTNERYSEIHNYPIRFRYANPNINKVG